MPRRDVNLTVVLGAGPNTTPVSGSWDQGIAVAADGHDDWGMLVGRPATVGDDIIGWTIRPQKEGDIATLRTMFDGTIEVKLGESDGTECGQPLWLSNDESGTLTTVLGEEAQRYMAQALEDGKGTGEYCEVYVFSQKHTLDG